MPNSKTVLAVSGGKGSSDRVGVVIAAAGAGQRMGGMDKIFAPVLGRPLLAWTIEPFQSSPLVDQIVLVVRRGSVAAAEKLAREGAWSKVSHACPGGARRQDSVAEGLRRLEGCRWAIIHDGARPCLTPDLIERGLAEVTQTGAAIAAVPVKDTIKVVGQDGLVRDTPQRRDLWAAQTPQVFRLDIIQEAHARAQGEATDDATLVEGLGYEVRVFMGSYDNIKVTTPEDLILAEAILRKRAWQHSG